MFKRNKEVDFFELFIQSGEYTKEASEKFLDLVKEYNNIPSKIALIKDVEHKADDHTHTIYKELNKAFITPIEREDILEINHNIDNVVDEIDHVSNLFYMFDVKTLEESLFPFAELINKSCIVLCEALSEFKNYKKPDKLIEKLIQINTIEEEGDRLYTESTRKLFMSGKDPIHITKWFEIYRKLEHCLDNCEEVANILEDVILKNT